MLPFNLLHDCNFFSISFLSSEVLYCRGLNYDECYVIHYHNFYSLNVIVTHSLDVVFVVEYIKINFTCTTLLSLTVVNERINQTRILIPTMILLSFANPKFAELLN